MFFTNLACAGTALVLLTACAGNIRVATPAAHSPQIVSLMPSLTEDLFAVGAGSQVIAVDRFSADIPGARNLPQVADFASVDTERIVQLHADVVLGIPAQARFLQPLRRAGIKTALLPNDSFADIFRDLRAIGRISGHAKAARSLEMALRRRTAALHRGIHFRHAPRVFVVLDASPIYTAGRTSYLSDLIALAGGKNAAENLPMAYGPYSAEALLKLQPDVLVADGSTGISRFLGAEPWRSLRAVQTHHVFVLQPADILERPGPRYNEGLRWLIARLRPLAS
ncbi:MAG: ABC transporter substrate-binding protein [Vulcanimicrobiaceae bacterium]